MLDVLTALITIGVIMVLGFIGDYIFKRVQIPSIIWLLFFGVGIGFILNIQSTISPALLINFSSFFAAVAILVILFDGGIGTDLYQMFKGAPRGLLLTLIGFIFSILGTVLVMILLSFTKILALSLENSIVIGVILGAVVGGTSSPIVIPLVSKLQKLNDKTKMMLSIESVITDILCIVVVLAAIYVVTSGISFDYVAGAKSLVSTFSVGAVLGFVLGLLWLPIMHKVRHEEFSYVLTLAIVFLVYSLAVTLIGSNEGGSGAGAIACLVFGIVLGNGKKILKMMNYTGEGFEMDQQTKQFHSLISFIIRTFFFVYLGIIVKFQKIEFIMIGIITLLVLLGVRYLAVKVSTYKGGFEKIDKQTMIVMMPRGLAAAILAINFGPLLVQHLLPGMEGFFTDITFIVVLGTTIICSIGVTTISYREKKKISLNETLNTDDKSGEGNQEIP